MNNWFCVTQSNVISGQSKGCWFVFQFRNWRLLLCDLWPRDPHAGAWLTIYVAAPWNTPRGYLDRRYGVELSSPFSRWTFDLTFVLPMMRDTLRKWLARANINDIAEELGKRGLCVVATRSAAQELADLRAAHRTGDWILRGKHINEFQQASIARAVRRCKQAHFTNLDIRINGKNEAEEADWVKWLEPVTNKQHNPEREARAAGGVGDSGSTRKGAWADAARRLREQP